VVFPISAWLIWLSRERLAALPVNPAAWMVVPVALAGLGWLLGQMVNVNALSHFALVSVLVFTAIGLLGVRASRELAFPLAFVFFGVPIGEFLMPALMHYTAEFTVLALRMSGVPVYQEGLFFVIPSGRWSVVEACSGLRYLIASLMVGTLFAYLNYSSVKKRLIFIGFAFVVPIVANWLRAYFIVMLGHLTDNRLAAGVDHLVYGWVFFGLIILLMFWIGSLWRDPVEKPSPVAVEVTASEPKGAGMVALGLPVLVVAALFPLLLVRVDAPVEPFDIAIEAPAPAPGWTAEETVFYDYLPIFSGYRGSAYRAYRRDDGEVVGLYIAYYAEQRKGAELVTWDNRLTIREYDSGLHWRLVTRRNASTATGDVLQSVISYGPRVLGIWHWYWSDGHVITRDEIAKLKLAFDRVTGRSDDAAFIAVLTPLASEAEDGGELVRAFLDDHAEAIETALVQAGAWR
jgi:exosortase A